MRPADSPHEVDNGHDHHARSNDLHAKRYCSAAEGPNNAGAGSDDNEQERTPSFGEKPPPFVPRLEKVWYRGGLQHTLVLRRLARSNGHRR
jgi:hypothetical protein